MLRSVSVLLLCLPFLSCSAGFTITASAGADLATTHYALGQGYSEGNPLFKNASMEQMVIAKVAVAGFLIWACHWLDSHGHHNFANALQWTATAVWGGAALWNMSKVN